MRKPLFVMTVLATIPALVAQDGEQLAVERIHEAYVEALDHVRARRFREAREILDSLVERGARSHQVLRLRAGVRGKLDDHAGAVGDLDRVIELRPGDGAAHAERAYHRYSSGDRDGALVDYDAALKLGHRTATVWGERGEVLKDSGRYAEAIESFRLATEKQPGWPHPWGSMARCAADLGDMETARWSYQQAIALGPGLPGWLPGLASAVYDCGDTQRAMQIVRRVEVTDYPAGTVDWLGDLAFRAGDLELARSLLRDAASESEGAARVRSLLTLGSTHLVGGSDDSAIEEFTAAREVGVESLWFWTHLMEWLVRARRDGLEPAGKWWAAQFVKDAPAPEPGSMEHEVLRTCLLPEGVEDIEAKTADLGREACAHLFVAAWRALVAAEESRSERLLRIAVNTGALDWIQWQCAVALLESRIGEDAMQPDFGWRCELEPVPEAPGEGEVRVVVRELAPGGAAKRQGWRVGDVITRVRQRTVTTERWEQACDVVRVGVPLFVERLRDGASEEVDLFAGVAVDG